MKKMKNKVIMIMEEREKQGTIKEIIMLMNGMLDLPCAQETLNLARTNRPKYN
jgi:NCAIR mutase (PurE)-related protein